MKRIALLIALMAAFSAAASGQAVIRVEAEVAVNTNVLTVGSIATIEGVDPQTETAIGKVRLGYSPMPGSWRELERGIIKSQLSLNGYTSDMVTVEAPGVVRVFRRSQVVEGSLLEARLRDYIVANAPWSPDEMVVSGITQVGNMTVTEGNLDIEILTNGSTNFLGNETFIAQLYVDGARANRVLMQANIRVMRDTVVAARGINPRQLIGELDVKIRRMDISSAQGDASLTLEEVKGMAARSYIRAGQVLTRNNVMMPVLVKRGQVVSLDARSKGFIIQTRGVAQQDGRKGDVVRVLNPSSKKIIEALVTGPQKTEVIF